MLNCDKLGCAHSHYLSSILFYTFLFKSTTTDIQFNNNLLNNLSYLLMPHPRSILTSIFYNSFTRHFWRSIIFHRC